MTTITVLQNCPPVTSPAALQDSKMSWRVEDLGTIMQIACPILSFYMWHPLDLLVTKDPSL